MDSSAFIYLKGAIAGLAAVELLVAGAYYFSGFIDAAMHPDKHARNSIVLRILIPIMFLVLRSIFVCILIGNIPYVVYPLWFRNFYTGLYSSINICFTMFLFFPPLFNIGWVSRKFGLGDRRKINAAGHDLGRVITILPVYNEEYSKLVAGVDSLLKSDYEDEIEVHISFDDEAVSELFLNLMKHFKKKQDRLWAQHHDNPAVAQFQYCCFGDEEDPFRSIHFNYQLQREDKTFESRRVFVHRFPHGGKRQTQAKAFGFIQRLCISAADNTEKMFALWVDSDNLMYRNTINNFITQFNANPEKQVLAGFMSCMSSNDSLGSIYNLMAILQDVEYISCEPNRGLEVFLGNITCAPGGLAMYRFKCLQMAAPHYFCHLPEERLIDFHRFYLGEDRYLTHLLHQILPARSLGFCPAARCKTDPPTTLFAFIKQRRRWLLGARSNDAYMLIDLGLWLKMPGLLVFKLLQNSWRTSALTQYLLMLIAVVGLSNHQTLVASISAFIFFGLAWIMNSYVAIRLRRKKVILLWPIYMLFSTFLQFMIDVYGMATWWRRSWGGPREVIELKDTDKKNDSISTSSLSITIDSFREKSNIGDAICDAIGYPTALFTDVPKDKLMDMVNTDEDQDDKSYDWELASEDLQHRYVAPNPLPEIPRRFIGSTSLLNSRATSVASYPLLYPPMCHSRPGSTQSFSPCQSPLSYTPSGSTAQLMSQGCRNCSSVTGSGTDAQESDYLHIQRSVMRSLFEHKLLNSSNQKRYST